MEKEFLLERHKATLQGWLASSQAMVDYSKMALRGAMLLNGAGIIPIVYSQVDYLYDSALLFGLGALMAACASGATYLVQWAITTSWECGEIYYPFRTSALDQGEVKAVRAARFWSPKIPWLRGIAISLVCISLLCFGLGLYTAHSSISSRQANQQEIQSPASQTHTLPRTAIPITSECCCLCF